MPEREPKSAPKMQGQYRRLARNRITFVTIFGETERIGRCHPQPVSNKVVCRPMDDDHVEKWRRQQRRRLLAERLAISPDQHRLWSAMIESRLSLLVKELPGAVIGLYWPVRAEFDPRPLAARLRKQGRVTALPAVIERGGRLEYRSWEDETAMAEGIYRIPVPSERRLLDPAIVVVPILGFDAANYRLGYGGGYFDRTLAALESPPLAIGAGFEIGHLDTVFPQSHDIAMDVIVTEAALQRKDGR